MWHSRHRMPRALIVAAALVASLTGCAPLGGQPSGTKPGPALPAVIVSSVIPGPQRSVDFANLRVAALDPASGGVRWNYYASWHPWHTPTAPVVADGVVYIESDTQPKDPNSTNNPTGALIALSENNGGTLWTSSVGFLAAAPVVADGVVYVSGLERDGAHTVTTFYALRASDGKRLWHTNIADLHSDYASLDQGFGILDDIQLVNGALYIRSNQVCFDQCAAAYLLALRASDGKRLWKDTIPGNITIQPPVIAGGSLYVFVPSQFNDATNSMGPSTLVAYNASDGSTRWTVPASAVGPMYAVDGLLYTSDIARDDPNNPNANTYTVRVLARDTATGATRWSFTSASNSSDSPLPLLAMSGDTIYAQSWATTNGATTYTLAGLDPRDGSPRWRTPLPHGVGLAKLDGSTLYAISTVAQEPAGPYEKATLMALPAAGGPPLWTAPLSPAPIPGGDSPAAILEPGGATLYASYFANTLSALDTQGSHATRWTADIPGSLRGVTVVS